jgi:prevent-host-death family protein
MAKSKTITINIHEAKTHLSKYLKKAEKGQRIVVCRRNVPIAVLGPMASPGVDRAKAFGMDKGKVSLYPEFFDPMIEEFPELYADATPESLAFERENAERMKKLYADVKSEK